MKPSIGRIVIVHDATQPSNGTTIMPAIITRTWSDGDPADADGANVCVNVTAFPDCGQPRPLSSINLFETEAEARESGFSRAAWWPDRSPARPATEMRSEAALSPETQEIVNGASAVGYGDSASVG